MKRPVAITIAAVLAFGSVAVASIGPAAAFSKEDLIQQLSGKGAGVAPQGQFVVDPNLLKKKRKLPVQPMMIVAPSGGISQPGGKKPMMLIKPSPVFTGSGDKAKLVAQPMVIQPQGGKTKMVVQPMIVAPGGGIKPAGGKPPIVDAVAAPGGLPTPPAVDAIAAPPGIGTPLNVADLRKMSQRKIVVEDRNKLAAAVQYNDLPSVDMEVYFAYDSAAIEPAAFQTLITLGQALSDPRLKGGTYLIAGHTDAVGTPAYNQALSERRAASIKSFLVQYFHLDPQMLLSVGYGEEQLKDPGDPTSGVNRRVQVANLTAQ